MQGKRMVVVMMVRWKLLSVLLFRGEMSSEWIVATLMMVMLEFFSRGRWCREAGREEGWDRPASTVRHHTSLPPGLLWGGVCWLPLLPWHRGLPPQVRQFLLLVAQQDSLLPCLLHQVRLPCYYQHFPSPCQPQHTPTLAPTFTSSSSTRSLACGTAKFYYHL